jgi:uncharacterized membrane protein
MGPFLISLFFTAGACTWIYTKLQKHSGNNTQQSLIAIGVTAAVMFLILYTVLGLVLKF